jgi:hypothetical protein
LDGDDAVAGAERFAGSADVVEGRRNLRVVLRVFVREHKLGRGGDSSVFIAVEPLDLF